MIHLVASQVPEIKPASQEMMMNGNDDDANASPMRKVTALRAPARRTSSEHGSTRVTHGSTTQFRIMRSQGIHPA